MVGISVCPQKVICAVLPLYSFLKSNAITYLLKFNFYLFFLFFRLAYIPIAITKITATTTPYSIRVTSFQIQIFLITTSCFRIICEAHLRLFIRWFDNPSCFSSFALGSGKGQCSSAPAPTADTSWHARQGTVPRSPAPERKQLQVQI